MAKPPRGLLIAVPTAPQGEMHVDLRAWLEAVEVQANLRRMLRAVHAASDDFKTRLEINRLMESAGTAHGANRARMLWVDPNTLPGVYDPMIPMGWDVTTAQVGGRTIAANRNDVVRRFLKTPHPEEKGPNDEPVLVDTPFEALGQIDSDCVPNHDSLHHICAALERSDVDAVSGIYCMDSPTGPQPIIYRKIGRRVARQACTELLGEDDLFELPRAGLPAGFLFVKRYVFEEMIRQSRVWFKDRYSDGSLEAFEIERILESEDPVRSLRALFEERMKEDWGDYGEIGQWKTGEDMWFCQQMQEAGFRLFVDRRCHVRHYKRTELKRQFIQQEQAGRVGFAAAYQHFTGDDDPEKISQAFESMMQERAAEGAKAKEAALQAGRDRR